PYGPSASPPSSPPRSHRCSLTVGPDFGVVRRERRTRHPFLREEDTRAIVSWVIRLTRNRRGQGEQSLPEKRGADRQPDAHPAGLPHLNTSRLHTPPGTKPPPPKRWLTWRHSTRAAWTPPLNVPQRGTPWPASATSGNESERRDEWTTCTAL